MSNLVPVRSDCWELDSLFDAFAPGAAERAVLDLGPGWDLRWTAGWRASGRTEERAARELEPGTLEGYEPVRRFSWRQRQRHRPGLEFLVSTGRLHGFESLEERSLLVALDFAGAVAEVLSQPFRLRFLTGSGELREHVPDFLAALRDGSRHLFDVRPAALIGQGDATCFAAAAEAALAVGWRYSVVAGWRPHALAALDALSAQRRPLEDRLGLQDRLLRGAADGAAAFGDLVAATPLPAVARAHALHLLWHRRLGTDLSRPLSDRSPVWRSGARP